MTELEKYIQTYFGVNQDDLTKISSFFKPVALKKGDYFLKTGRQSDRLGFVQSGIIRELVFHRPLYRSIQTNDNVFKINRFICSKQFKNEKYQ